MKKFRFPKSGDNATAAAQTCEGSGMKMRLVAMSLGVALLGACVDRSDQPSFDGQYFRAKASKVDDDRAVFTVRIRDVNRSLDGAREAGRYAGTDYCIQLFGSSKIIWGVGPDTPPEQLRVVDDTLVFDGVCPKR